MEIAHLRSAEAVEAWIQKEPSSLEAGRKMSDFCGISKANAGSIITIKAPEARIQSNNKTQETDATTNDRQHEVTGYLITVRGREHGKQGSQFKLTRHRNTCTRHKEI